MSLDRADIRSKLFLRLPGLGGKRTATDIDTDGIIDPTAFQRSEASDGDFAGAVIYRPNVGESDRLREAGLVDGNKLLQTGAAWSDVIDLDYELYYLLHPYVVNECIREAPHEIYGEVYVPLTLWADGDFALPDVTHWDNGTIAAPTKSTSYKWITNSRALVVAASGGNLYAESDEVSVDPGESIFHAAIGAIETSSSGEAYYALWDATHDEAIYENTFTSYRDQIVRKVSVIPDGCYKVTVRVGAVANGCTTVWKALPSHHIGARSTPVQSWLKEQMNLLGFGPAEYGRSTGTDLHTAGDFHHTEWATEQGADYKLLPLVPASDFYTIQINRPSGLQGEDYWIHGYRRMSDIQEEMDDEAAVTDIDEEMMLTAVECLVTEKLGPDYATMYQACKSKLIAQRVARPVIQPTRQPEIAMIGMRRGRHW